MEKLVMLAATLMMVLPVLMNLLLTLECGIPLLPGVAFVGAIPAFILLVYMGEL